MAGPRLISLSQPDEKEPQSPLAQVVGRPEPAAGVANRSPAILRDVNLKIKQAGPGPECLEFDGTARGDTFERMRLKGTVNLATGNVTLEGELSGLTLSETLRRRIPLEARPMARKLALNSGVVDIELDRFRYDPAAAPGRRVSYRAAARLRDGVWECPNLPFFVNELSADLRLEDGLLLIKHAQGSNGQTGLRVEGSVGLCDMANAPLGRADRPG